MLVEIEKQGSPLLPAQVDGPGCQRQKSSRRGGYCA